MANSTHFGELKNDKNFVQAVTAFEKNLDKIEKSLDVAVNFKDYDELSTQEKVKFDNYLAYSINSLYWMYIKLQGLDPNEHGIKNELSRVRQTILRDKQIYERNTIRPVLDKGAAGRFIKHGLHIKRSNNDDETENDKDNESVNKRIRFDDGEEE